MEIQPKLVGTFALTGTLPGSFMWSSHCLIVINSSSLQKNIFIQKLFDHPVCARQDTTNMIYTFLPTT